MVHRDIGDIIIPYGTWDTKKEIKSVFPNIGWDTETIKGKCHVIANSFGECWVRGIDFEDISDIFEVLTRSEYQRHVNWFFNVDFDTNALLACMPDPNQSDIAEVGLSDYMGYRMEIIPDKELSISRLKIDNQKESKLHAYQTFTAFDLAQMFDYQSLGSLALKYTNRVKPEVKDIGNLSRKRIIENKDGYRDIIKNRCIEDCLILKDIADIHTNSMGEIVKTNVHRSKASYARQYFLTNIKHNLGRPPKHVSQAALWAFHGGMIELLKCGAFNKPVHNYDLRSAYPAEIAELYTTLGHQKYNKEYEPDNIAYSFYEIDIDYADDHISPLFFLHKNQNFHANGQQTAWVNKAELEFLMDKGYDFKILHARHIFKRSEDDQPFKELVHTLYDKRVIAKADGNDDLQKAIKILLNSSYGVTLSIISRKREIPAMCDENGDLTTDYIDAMDNNDTSEYDKSVDSYKRINGRVVEYHLTRIATNMYNPSFGAEITANVRIKMLDDFWKDFRKGKVISLNTDGIFLSDKSRVKLKDSLGGWDYKEIPKSVFLGNGQYVGMNDMGEVMEKLSAHRCLSLNTRELLNEITKHKNENRITVMKESPIKRKESRTREDYRGKLNQFVLKEKVLKLGNIKREWFGEIKTFNDLLENRYDSSPRFVDDITGD